MTEGSAIMLTPEATDRDQMPCRLRIEAKYLLNDVDLYPAEGQGAGDQSIKRLTKYRIEETSMLLMECKLPSKV